ncbi:MAG: heavy-metal-associated domain-containing protein [Candidatus Riflebacteria bacterium]|nr:heavy-metal-associated domain-containing protein [Candidatus Riflebacteria bacterium]
MKITWHVDKMKCDGCVEAIAQALLLVDGLADVTVDLASKSVAFTADTQQTVDVARKAMQGAGFPVRGD